MSRLMKKKKDEIVTADAVCLVYIYGLAFGFFLFLFGDSDG